MRVKRRARDLFDQPRIFLRRASLDLLEDALLVIGEWHRSYLRGPALPIIRTRSSPVIGRRARIVSPGLRRSADAVASGTFEQCGGHRRAPAEALLRPVDGALNVSPPLAAKERQLLRSRRL